MLKLVNLFFTVFLFISFSQTSFAFFEEATFKKANVAYKKKQISLLSKYTNELKAKHYELAPYAEYWLMRRNINQISNAKVIDLINRTEGFAFNQPLRASFLRKLARNNEWGLFDVHAPLYVGDDAGVKCAELFTKAKQGKKVASADVHALWLTKNQQPSECNPLFKMMVAKGVISTTHKYERLRLALLSGKTSLARSIAVKLPGINNKLAKLINRAKKNPERFLSKRVASFQGKFGVEMNLFALDRLARRDVDKAVKVYRNVKNKFNRSNRALGWGIIAYRASKQLDPKAMTYYGYAGGVAKLPERLVLNDVYLERNAWYARAALRAEQWRSLLNIIEKMPEVQADKARWRYWKARAIKVSYGGNPEKLAIADALLINLGSERHYYGWLAAEEVGMPVEGFNNASSFVNDQDLKRIAKIPQIQRAVSLQKLGVRREAGREWYAAIRQLSDKDRLAASTYAKKIGWNDISINTADATTQEHDFSLRYPTPYHQYFKQAAAAENIDEAWVFGLVRQESRFMDYAKSRVGAAGLMQLMPNTAKWAAKKKGMRSYKRKKIHDVKTNVALGTFYMRYTLDMMKGQAVMATAAYNAGPSRAIKWMADKPLEGAIYMETIPFNETRNYVQRVMANAHLYAPRIGTKIQTLKQRIGTIPAKGQ